jgi:hypothetical protein
MACDPLALSEKIQYTQSNAINNAKIYTFVRKEGFANKDNTNFDMFIALAKYIRWTMKSEEPYNWFWVQKWVSSR